MLRLTSPAGATVSYDQYGSGPPLVLVHGVRIPVNSATQSSAKLVLGHIP
jgi:hypothetical protein